MAIPVITPENHSEFPAEQIGSDTEIQWLDGGRIYKVRTGYHTVEDFANWEAGFRAMLDAWSPERPLCLMFDLRSPKFSLTINDGTRVRNLIQDYDYLSGSSAFVYAPTFRGTTLVTTLNLIPFGSQTYRQYFTDYDRALTWLQYQFAARQIS